MSLGSFECGSSRHIIWEVGRITILDSALSLRIGVRLQFHTQLVRTVHNTSLTVGAVRTTSGQNHRNSIGRKDCTRIDVAAVSTHQGIHVPVAVINVGNTVQNIITGRGIVLVRAIPAAFVVITRARVSITSFMGIIPGTSIGIHCIVTDTHTVALIQECLDSIIGFTGKVRFLVNADAPANRVDTVVAFSVHHIQVRVLVEFLCSNRKHRNVLAHVRTIVVAQPTIIGNIVDVVCVDTTSIGNPRIQENNSVLVLCTRCASAITTIVAKNSSVSGNIDRSASQIPIVTVVVWTEINGLTIPFRVDFEHIAIR